MTAFSIVPKQMKHEVSSSKFMRFYRSTARVAVFEVSALVCEAALRADIEGASSSSVSESLRGRCCCVSRWMAGICLCSSICYRMVSIFISSDWAEIAFKSGLLACARPLSNRIAWPDPAPLVTTRSTSPECSFSGLLISCCLTCC
jgi:hypothetical protein